jgi:hypothetical protein
MVCRIFVIPVARSYMPSFLMQDVNRVRSGAFATNTARNTGRENPAGAALLNLFYRLNQPRLLQQTLNHHSDLSSRYIVFWRNCCRGCTRYNTRLDAGSSAGFRIV